MVNLDVQGFCDFFHELWGNPPFAWQRELAQQLLENEASWPKAIALPTSAGKTACLDIAVYNLASQADRIAADVSITAPRRIFFVVDRRVIVDEAFDRASRLSTQLSTATKGIIKVVADKLRKLAGNQLPLACFQLRGGMYRSDAWAKSPVQPIIVASTVDQIGSRLLFRAYGRSSKAWPIQAGLAANDSLILLDEAHCSQPFMETLQAIGKYRNWATNPLSIPFQAVVMSATPPSSITDILIDTSGESQNPEHPLGKRQLASKPATLHIAEKAKGKAADAEMAKSMAEQAELLIKRWHENHAQPFDTNKTSGEAPNAPALVVFCNRVATARAAHAILSKKHGNRAVLLTGRMRPIDKDTTTKGPLAVLSANTSVGRSLVEPVYVIATQTLEVGANLDFDLLVTECASLDALRQRFGRLNRMGRSIKAMGSILIRQDQMEKSEEDPVYAEALSNTWKWLVDSIKDDDSIDMGIAALNRLIQDINIDGLNSPATHAPILLPAHVDALAQTAPEPCTLPEIALFLHGPRSSPADVQVCWRADLTGTDEVRLQDAVILCPPAAPECLSVPFNQMRRWLAGETLDQGVDVEGIEAIGEPSEDSTAARRVVRWRGRNDVQTIQSPSQLRPGDVVVIPADLQGWETLATLGSSTPTPDWGDRAYALARDKAILRLHMAVLDQYPPGEVLEPLRHYAEYGPHIWADDPDILYDELKACLAAIADNPAIPPELDWIKTSAAGLLPGFNVILSPTGGLTLLGRQRLNLFATEADDFSDEDDSTASSTTWSLLDEHLTGTAKLAAWFAHKCGLDNNLSSIVENAALYHDLGKADPRFQAWLHNGNPWIRGPLLAKSQNMPQGRKESESARKRAGYPRGGRHELLSVRLLESNPISLPREELARDLLLHLIASHHGHCRPFAPIVDDEKATHVLLGFRNLEYAASSKTELHRLDSGIPERFWRLNRHFGWWGLAYLEAMVRLSDHRRSEVEEYTQRGSKNV